jgi:hypothetical protein
MPHESDTPSIVRTTVFAMREAARHIVRVDLVMLSEQLRELERAMAILAEAIELKRLANGALY